MKNYEERLNKLVEERNMIANEMEELQNAYNIRQQKIIEISGDIKILQELITENTTTESSTELEDNTVN